MYCCYLWSSASGRERYNEITCRLLRHYRTPTHEWERSTEDSNRRVRGDLIETYKILTGKENVDSSKFFVLNHGSHNLRGHRLKLYKSRSRLNTRKFFYSHRVVEVWNSLPDNVVEAETTIVSRKGWTKRLRVGHLKLKLQQPDIYKYKYKYKYYFWPAVPYIYNSGCKRKFS